MPLPVIAESDGEDPVMKRLQNWPVRDRDDGAPHLLASSVPSRGFVRQAQVRWSKSKRCALWKL